jgi:hypothetical protein
MLASSDDLMSIVVLEAGAAWPAWLAEYQRFVPNAVVIAQSRAESPDAFRSRVAHRITEATATTGARVRIGVIVAGDSGDLATVSAREAIARAIIKVMRSGDEAELVLGGDAQAGDSSRHELFALAGVLCQELGGTEVSVNVRLSSGKSGVMRTASVASADIEPAASKGAI